ncbi:MAG: hypothetical protein ACJ762_03270 [Solirubrobacteraceae bacterium]
MSPDPCPTCGAAMAADQRYCLACGRRRAEARLDYLEILRASPAVAAGPATAVAADARQRANVTLIASIGCLLLAMGVGVLIGTAGGNDTAALPAAAPAQVIKVQGGGTAATADTAAKPAADKKKQAKKKTGGDDENTAKTAADSKATNPALTELDSTSGDDYTKQSDKLPKVVSTGGKAPPKDDKAPAGGGDFEEIG